MYGVNRLGPRANYKVLGSSVSAPGDESHTNHGNGGRIQVSCTEATFSRANHGPLRNGRRRTDYNTMTLKTNFLQYSLNCNDDYYRRKKRRL